MLNKILGILIICFIGTLEAEIIHISKLVGKAIDPSVKRDIFSPYPQDRQISENLQANVEKKKEEKQIDKKEMVESEIRGNVFYDGFLAREKMITALVTVSGETFNVKEGDTILDKIKIISISEKILGIEVEGFRFDIEIRGE